MVRTEISLFLKNVPGELGRLATMFGEAGINIDALTIQDASSYVQELFKAGVPGWLFPNTSFIVSFAPFNNLPTQYRISVDGEQKWFGQ